MHATLMLHGILLDYRPPESSGRVFELTIEEGATVRSVVERLGIPANALYLAFLDRQQVDLDAQLANGASLWLFPPVTGG